MPILFQEDKLTLELELDMLAELTAAIGEKAENLETHLDYAYDTHRARCQYAEIAMLRDLQRLHLLFTKRLELCLLSDRKKTRLSLPVSYIYLLHTEIVYSFSSHGLQLAINRLDALIKSYPYSYRLKLRS